VPCPVGSVLEFHNAKLSNAMETIFHWDKHRQSNGFLRSLLPIQSVPLARLEPMLKATDLLAIEASI
jgi:hypothetical protein